MVTLDEKYNSVKQNLKDYHKRISEIPTHQLNSFIELNSGIIDYSSNFIDLHDEIKLFKVDVDTKRDHILNKIRMNIHNYSKEKIQSMMDYLDLL